MSEPKGYAFPFRIERGGVAASEGDRKLAENLQHILRTDLGERFMNRQYGAGIRGLLHDPNDDALQTLLTHQITKAVMEFEPRIQIQSLNLLSKGGELYVDIAYTLRTTLEPGRAEIRIATQPQ